MPIFFARPLQRCKSLTLIILAASVLAANLADK